MCRCSNVENEAKKYLNLGFFQSQIQRFEEDNTRIVEERWRRIQPTKTILKWTCCNVRSSAMLWLWPMGELTTTNNVAKYCLQVLVALFYWNNNTYIPLGPDSWSLIRLTQNNSWSASNKLNCQSTVNLCVLLMDGGWMIHQELYQIGYFALGCDTIFQ